MPPKEPWEYGEGFTDFFRRVVELKYRLMPYVYAQANDASRRGLPMLRALFVDFPDDPGSWLVEDEYLFGSDMLVAPLMEESAVSRAVYVPPGAWIDYQTGRAYASGWQTIDGGALNVVVLVREGAAVPHIALAQSTSRMDWSKLELVAYSRGGRPVRGLVCLPADNELREVSLVPRGTGYSLAADPFGGKVAWTVRRYDARALR